MFHGQTPKRRDIKVSANAETSALTSEVLARHFTLLEVFPNPFYWFLMIVPLLLLFVFRRFGWLCFFLFIDLIYTGWLVATVWSFTTSEVVPHLWMSGIWSFFYATSWIQLGFILRQAYKKLVDHPEDR